MTPPASPKSPAPINLLAGGRWHSGRRTDPLFCDCLQQTLKDSPSVAYIGVASNDDQGFFRKLSAVFRDAGAGSVTLVTLATGRPDMETARRILAMADLIFISGGDVRAGMDCLDARGLHNFLQRLHRLGKPFLGLSAGSIMLAQHWIDWTDPDDDSTATPFRCLGLAPIVCDTHAEADDWQELRMLLHLLPEGVVGYGIPAEGGLRLRGTHVTALGRPLQRFCRAGTNIRQLSALNP